MSVSVIIPTYNRANQALELVEYLCNVLKFNGQIIIVDQSDDASNLPQKLVKYSNVVRYVQKKMGTGKARNFGANQAQNEWLCFLDDDVRPTQSFFEKVINFLEVNPWVDVLQPEILQREDWNKYLTSPIEWTINFESASKTQRDLPAPNLDGVQWFMEKPNSPYGVLSLRIGAGAFFIQRDAFFMVGGFDETLTGSGDDSDLAIRLWWYGYRTYYYPQIAAFHLHEKSGGLRASKSKSVQFNILLRPEPTPGIIYLYKKWFPGYPTMSFYVHYLFKNKNFFFLPVKLIRLMMAIRAANKLMITGARYINGIEPKPRMEFES